MTEPWTPEDEERLRRALHDEAAKIVPSPGGLDRILARTRRTPSRSNWWRSPAVLGVAAALVAAVVVIGGGLTVLRGPDADVTATVGEPATTSPTPSPTEPEPTPTEPEPTPTEPEPTPTEPEPPAPEETPEPPFTGALPVWFISDTSAGPRLAREWRRVTTVSNPAEVAVALMMAAPEVPEYSTPWDPLTSVRSVAVRDDAIEVDLSFHTDADAMPADQAELAIQQLVYTATAATSVAGGDGSLPVRVLVDGERVDELWGFDVSEPLGRADALDVRQVVQLNDPSQGEVVTSPVRVTGEAAVHEATVLWEVYRDGEVVADGFTTAAGAFEFTPFEVDPIELQPGEYTIVVSDTDDSDGEGPGPTTDARTFTVTD